MTFFQWKKFTFTTLAYQLYSISTLKVNISIKTVCLCIENKYTARFSKKISIKEMIMYCTSNTIMSLLLLKKKKKKKKNRWMDGLLNEHQ